jgi:hypothetical protein
MGTGLTVVIKAKVPHACFMVPDQKRRASRQGRSQMFWNMATKVRSLTRSENQVRARSVKQPNRVAGIVRRLVLNYMDEVSG